jgi:hypothetical protein
MSEPRARAFGGDVPMRAVAATALGALLCAVGLVVDPRRTAAAYLVAYVACLSVVLGALAMIMIARVTAATWFVVLRREAEQVAAVLPALAVLFVPVVAAMRWLYPWVAASQLPTGPVRDAALAKGAYLNVPFFLIRAAAYWAVWLTLTALLRRASLREDGGPSAEAEHRTYVASAVGLPLFALATSFAAFDWMMSLDPTWYSTIYGVSYFAGGMVGAVALLVLLVIRGRRRGELPEPVGADHLHALGKLLLTFLLFWIYIAFSQYIVIWSADLPVEAEWYVVRTQGAWGALAAVLIAGHFAIPFCALLLRAVKRSAVAMGALGMLLLVMHYADVYWMVMPDAAQVTAGSVWMDGAAVLFVGGAASLAWAVRRAGEPTVPRGDPALAASIAYRSD